MEKNGQVAKIARALVRETAANISDYSDREEEFRLRFEELVSVHQELQLAQNTLENADGVGPTHQAVTALSASVKECDEEAFISLMQNLIDTDPNLAAIINDCFCSLYSARDCGELTTIGRKALPRIEGILFG